MVQPRRRPTDIRDLRGTLVRITRTSAVGAVALVGALALSACGSDNTSTGGSGSGSSASAATNADCFSGQLNAEGSTAQKNAIEQAIKAFQTACGDATINYNATGSGAGIKQFTGGQVDFAGSDSALKSSEQEAATKTCGSPAWDLPMVAGPIAVAYNVSGVDKLVLDASTTAKIFQGQITTWNDPAIAKLNSGVTLPSTAIKVFFRSDESGTTENFTKYLNATAPDVWTATPAKKWAGKGEGKEKSAGVSTAVKSTDGGITYTEWSYAQQNDLKIAAIDTGSGTPVELTGDSAGKAIAAATQSGSGNDLALKLDYATKAEGAYPIVLVTYEIVCSKYSDSAKATKVKAFLKSFSSDETQKSLESLGYAPLPSEIATKVQTAVDAIS
ncbi:phosphate ABC transporter substrate-binding protein (PhoT family) [Lapillicoccus jejuensis]|uniref:Phosphate-binding protein n=1 Tax=Lapillicoccus jejuensis TaxID=402171 RepID=A0A542E0H1_9MICO|nr:phosphate ABC transporter substrate-binding protein (PhoT family) [Lapillicoccus jejuensis]